MENRYKLEQISENEYKIINEDQNVENTLASALRIFYIHLIKYVYCREHQDTNWEKSLKDQSKIINRLIVKKKITKNVMNSIDMENIMMKAIATARKECEKYHNHLDTIPNNFVFAKCTPPFDSYNLDHLRDINMVEAFIKAYKR